MATSKVVGGDTHTVTRSFETVTDKLSAGWTAPTDGTLTVAVKSTTNVGRYFLQDVTSSTIVIMIAVSTSNYYQSSACPVIKGHTYKTTTSDDVSMYNALFYNDK